MIVDLLHRTIRLRFHRLGFRSRVLSTDSCRLHYYQRPSSGTETPLLFIHGLGTSSSTWIKILPSLSSAGSVSCVDLPGHGFSKITNGDPFFSLHQLDEALEQFIGQTQPVPVILIGHSLGGWLAARFAVRNPGSVRRLILINNAGVYYPGAERQADAFTLKHTGDVRKLLGLLWYRYPWYFKPFTGGIFHSLQKRKIGPFVASVHPEDFLNPALAGLQMPVDVIWGEEDRLISRQAADVMRRSLPDVRIRFIPRCGHVPQLERPDALASCLNAILSKKASGS